MLCPAFLPSTIANRRRGTASLEKLGHFAFKGVADELKGPANQEKDQRPCQERVDKNRCHEQGEAHHDDGDAEGVAGSIHRVLVAGCVLRDPPLVAFSAPHVSGMVHRNGASWRAKLFGVRQLEWGPLVNENGANGRSHNPPRRRHISTAERGMICSIPFGPWESVCGFRTA